MGVGVMTGVWTIFAYDINTNTLLTELVGRGLTFDCRMNDSGSISFSLDLQSVQVRNLAGPVLAYDGEPFKAYVDLDGQIMWGGICWTTNYQKSTGQMDFGGREFPQWADLRVAVADYSALTYPNGIDPSLLLGKVLTDAQNVAVAGAGASIGLQVVAPASKLPSTVPGYPTTQLTTLSQIINDMVTLSLPGVGGIDYTSTSQWVGGIPVDTFRVWSPRAGRVAGSTGLIFDLDSALDYTWPSDASQSGNTLTATGAGTGASMPVAHAQAPGIPLGGLGQAPRLDKVLNYSSVQSQAQLSLIATGAAALYGPPVTTPTVVVPALSGVTPLGSWALGDDARIYTGGDDRFPNGKDEYWRIIQHSVTVPDEGLPTVTVTLNLPPSF